MTTLYDHNGRQVRAAELEREIVTPRLLAVRSVWDGTVAGGLTPVRLASILMGATDGDHSEYLTLAEEMEEREMHYACELSKRKLAVSRLPVTVESYSDNPKDIEMADAVRDLARKPDFRVLLKDLLDAVGKGYSVCEIMWDRSVTRWTPSTYVWRDPRLFCFDGVTRAEIRLLNELNTVDGVTLPDYKFIRHVPKIKSGIPIRGGIARLAAWAWMCKGYAIKDWLAFAEVFGMPLRLGKYDAGASEADKDVLRMAVANLGTDAAAVFPSSMSIELKEASKAGNTDFFQRLADYLDAQISRGILGQTATTQGTPGKLGNEDAQKEIREEIRDDDADQLADTLGRDLIRPYIDLNFGPQENYPRVQLRAPKKEDIKALTTALEKLVPLGLRVEQSVIRDRLCLPDPPVGADILHCPTALPLGFNTSMPNAFHVSALNQSGRDPKDDIETDIEGSLADWQSIISPLIEPIRKALDESEDQNEFEKRISTIFEEQDASALVDNLSVAMFRKRVEAAENVQSRN